MKDFNLFYGESGVVGTHNITKNPKYKPVVETIQQIRQHFFSNATLRGPILALFANVYDEFPEKLKKCGSSTPVFDHMEKTREIRSHPPSDEDVVEFLTISFPDLHLDLGSFAPEDLLRGVTRSGRTEAGKEEVTINVRLVHQWLAASDQGSISQTELSFMFLSVFIHELCHSALVWYGAGSCNSPNLNGIDSEAGNFLEMILFGGISSCGISMENFQINQVGLETGGNFYPISKTQAAELLKLDTSNGLPLINPTNLTPSSPIPGQFRAKISISRLKIGFSDGPMPIKPLGVIYTRKRSDKIIVLPAV